MKSSLKCPIRPYGNYSVLRLDKDDNTFKATLLSSDFNLNINWTNWSITEKRVIYNQDYVVFDFHTFNLDDKVNYVIVRNEGLLAYIEDIVDECSGLKCSIRPCNSYYKILRHDEDRSFFKATLLSFNSSNISAKYSITESRVLYDLGHVVYNFSPEGYVNNDNDNNDSYMIIRDEGLIACIGDEKSFHLGDK